jgi:SNF2 family DNA or RNA helicase
MILVRLPSVGGRPLPSPDLALDGPPADAEAPTLGAWQVNGLVCDPAQAPTWLLAFAAAEAETAFGPAPVVLGADLRFWIAATRFALELLHRQRLLPTLQLEGAGLAARWRPLLDEQTDRDRFNALVAAMLPAGRAPAWDTTAPEPGPRALLAGYLDATVDAVARQAAPRPPARRGRAPKRRGLGEAWLAALRGEPLLDGTPDELAAFYNEYRTWVEQADGTTAHDSFRVCFRLNPPPADQQAEGIVVPRRGEQNWTVEYLLQAADDPSLLVSAAEVWRQRGATVRFLNRKFEQPQERLLAGLGRASRLFPPLEASLHGARPEVATLTTEQAYNFVREGALLLQAGGFGVLVPGLDTKLGLRVRLKGRPQSKKSQTHLGVLSFGQMIEFDWQVALGDQTVTRAEFEALARLKEPLVQVRGRWVELRPELVEQALALFDKQGAGRLALPDALKLALAPNGQFGVPITEVTAEGWVDELLRDLRDGPRRAEVPEPPGFLGRLRPYQKIGVGWLAALRRYGLGACLADDMGLGKTIQLIALLLHHRAAGAGAPTLLICPTSVVGNWRRELTHFAPELRVLVHHGAGRSKETFAADVTAHDVVISTYPLLHRDAPELTAVEWENVVLDEAQNIKNPSTRAAQAARRLSARWRAALTGTPVENRLTELWSIFQFLNPGYLGSENEFRQRFARPIERTGDGTATTQLKALVAPFILRRLKTDRSIIADLPEKNEMKVYSTLTREQATLYEAVLQEALKKVEESEGINRRGAVLAMITKLKQICDHPVLFLHDGSALPDRSGKLERLGEMLEEALAVGDRALIFTQFAEMGKLLQDHLQTLFGREVFFLHGGTAARERDRMVTRFQQDARAPHLFVLSLKAGGVGLNLTRANHVFHFDRWWNPAVENQATDRVFRIGQRRDVQVHKFVSAGTFEEAIDQLIEKKRELSEAIVGAGEAWITEMSNQELRDLFALRHDAVQGE